MDSNRTRASSSRRRARRSLPASLSERPRASSARAGQVAIAGALGETPRSLGSLDRLIVGAHLDQRLRQPERRTRRDPRVRASPRGVGDAERAPEDGSAARACRTNVCSAHRVRYSAARPHDRGIGAGARLGHRRAPMPTRSGTRSNRAAPRARPTPAAATRRSGRAVRREPSWAARRTRRRGSTRASTRTRGRPAIVLRGRRCSRPRATRPRSAARVVDMSLTWPRATHPTSRCRRRTRPPAAPSASGGSVSSRAAINRRIVGGTRSATSPSPDERAGFHEHPHHLLEEERVAVRARHGHAATSSVPEPSLTEEDLGQRRIDPGSRAGQRGGGQARDALAGQPEDQDRLGPGVAVSRPRATRPTIGRPTGDRRAPRRRGRVARDPRARAARRARRPVTPRRVVVQGDQRRRSAATPPDAARARCGERSIRSRPAGRARARRRADAHRVRHRVGQGRQASTLAERRAAAEQETLRRQRLAELLRQPALADAGLSRDHQHPRCGLVLGQLELAAEQVRACRRGPRRHGRAGWGPPRRHRAPRTWASGSAFPFARRRPRRGP